VRAKFLLLALALLVVLGAAAALGGATKVTICHRTGGAAAVTLSVDESAVPAHLAHGDQAGACTISGSK
jgi:hypothetical protein